MQCWEEVCSGKERTQLEFRGKIRGLSAWTKHSNLIVAQDRLYGMLAISCFLRPLLECLILHFGLVQQPSSSAHSDKHCAKARKETMKRYTHTLCPQITYTGVNPFTYYGY